MRLVLLVLAIIPTLAADAQTGKPAEAPIPTFTVCEILSHRVEYNGKLVRIRASVLGTDEGAWFAGDGCPGVVRFQKNASFGRTQGCLSLGKHIPSSPTRKLLLYTLVSDRAVLLRLSSFSRP